MGSEMCIRDSLHNYRLNLPKEPATEPKVLHYAPSRRRSGPVPPRCAVATFGSAPGQVGLRPHVAPHDATSPDAWSELAAEWRWARRVTEVWATAGRVGGGRKFRCFLSSFERGVVSAYRQQRARPPVAEIRPWSRLSLRLLIGWLGF